MKVKEESGKSGLKLNIQKMKIIASGPITSWQVDGEQWTDSKSGKDYVKAVYCHPVYLTYTQNTSCEMLGWMKHKLGSTLLGEISITLDIQMTSPLRQKTKRK